MSENRNTKRAVSQTLPQSDPKVGFTELGVTQAQKKNKMSSDWNPTTLNTRSESTKAGQLKQTQQQ